jgi:hypothetical protein
MAGEIQVNGANARKASGLRAKGNAIGPVDKLWLSEYDEAIARRAKERADRRKRHGIGIPDGASIGASSKERTLKVDLVEKAEAAGIGAPAVAAIAAGAALEAKEEGRRLDALTLNSLEIMKEAVSVYRDVAITLRKHWAILASSLSDAMATNHDNRATIAELEAENIRLQKELEGKGETPEQMMMAAAFQRFMAGGANGSATGNGTKNGQG